MRARPREAWHLVVERARSDDPMWSYHDALELPGNYCLGLPPPRFVSPLRRPSPCGAGSRSGRLLPAGGTQGIHGPFAVRLLRGAAQGSDIG